MTTATSKAMPEGVKWWLIGSVAVLLGSLVLFVGNIVASFVFPAGDGPLWVTVMGAVSVFGMCLGFGGVFVSMIMLVVKARRGDKSEAAEQG